MSKFITNMYNPNLPDAYEQFPYLDEFTKEREWKNFLNWLSNKEIGEPQPTTEYTVEELKQMNIVGIYG